MKKYIYFLITIFFLSLTASYSSCPPWATNSNIYIFTVNDCKYAATVCWKCPVGLGETWITIDYPVPVDNCSPEPPTDLGKIKRAILEQLSAPSWLYQLCSGYPFPECPSNSYTYKIKDYTCTYMFRDYDNNVSYHICNFNAWCEQTWYICWDIYGPHKYLLNDWNLQGNYTCPTTIMPGVPENPGEYSTCWDWNPCL